MLTRCGVGLEMFMVCMGDDVLVLGDFTKPLAQGLDTFICRTSTDLSVVGDCTC